MKEKFVAVDATITGKEVAKAFEFVKNLFRVLPHAIMEGLELSGGEFTIRGTMTESAFNTLRACLSTFDIRTKDFEPMELLDDYDYDIA